MAHNVPTLWGSFKQVITLRNLPKKGAIQDQQLEIIEDAGIIVQDGKILKIDTFEKLASEVAHQKYNIQEVPQKLVVMPAFVDCHTHICFAGNRTNDFAQRIAGKSYLEIAKNGGGIANSVRKTRQATLQELLTDLQIRAKRLLSQGITTCEIKSGYGLSVEHELKMLEAIEHLKNERIIDVVATCLATHICPQEFKEPLEYVKYILNDLLPIVKQQNLSNRVDIFLEETAFNYDVSRFYLQKAKELGFEIIIHADQFSTEGSKLAVELNALSADHLEASKDAEIQALGKSNVICTVLPGASLGLGMDFAPARKLLDANCCVAISSDWNPGSAPMGDLLTEASILATFQKLSTAEIFAGITFRAANALNLYDRGILAENHKADFIGFSCEDYREILYHQGKLQPSRVWKDGLMIVE
jgi:imidazolonepropionase